MDKYDFLDDVGSTRSAFNTDKAIEVLLRKWGNYFIEEAKKNLLKGLKKNNSSSDPTTGDLYASISPIIEVEGKSFRFAIQMAEYWKNVEHGRGEGLTPPPIKPIIEWLQSKPNVANKFGLTRTNLKSNKVVNFKGLQVKQSILSAAIATSRSIGEKGIKPTNFLAQTINEQAIKQFKKEITIALNKNITVSITRKK